MKKLSVLFVLLAVITVLPASAQEADIRFPLPEEATPITIGDMVEGSIGGDAQAVAYSFEGSEDDAISAYVLSETDESVYLYLIDPDGELVVLERISFINLDYKAYIPLYILEDDGEYQLIVTTSDNAIFGEADLEVDFTLVFDEPEYTVLELGDSVEGELTMPEAEEGQDEFGLLYTSAVYLLEINRGEIPYITLQSPSGVELTVEPLSNPEAQAFSPNRASDGIGYISPLYASERETYVLSVHGSLFPGDAEAYTLTVEDYEPYAIASGETVAVPISVETLRNYLRFEAEAGDEVSIALSAGEATNPAVVLFDPAGRFVEFSDTGTGFDGIELLEDGEYTLMVFPQANVLIDAEQLGEVEVTLTLE